MSAEEYARLPTTLPVRETRYEVSRPGFRVRTVTLVSTLLDGDAYPAQELAGLYRRRWQVEKAQADYPSRRRWVGAWRIGYHRCDGVARTGRVVPATPGRPHRRSRMSDPTRRPAPRA